MRNREVEVLAPAGSYDCFRAAISAGADAVYAGGSRFGARAYADNFSEEELIRAIEEAHLFGKKLYLTVNTLLKDNEIKELSGYLSPLYEKGLDAVIVQDVGVLEYIKSEFPELDIHASTQMTITGYPGAAFFEKAGAVRVVPARELSLAEIREIREHTDLEIECFVHGALCYSYSGQCLLSSVIGGRSGNRGQCAQPCRLPWATDGHRKYYMSLKDMCTLDLIPDLIEAGVDSFKIEGRMKKPEYVAAVTSVYRKYTDLYLEKGTAGFQIDPEDREMLLDLYNRGGFHTGYYKQHNGRNMLSLDRPNHAGVPAVVVNRRRGRKIDGTALTDLKKGDVLELGAGKKSNYTLGTDLPKGASVSLLLPKDGKAEKGTTFPRVRSESLIQTIRKNFLSARPQREAEGFLSLVPGSPARLTVKGGGQSVSVNSEVNVQNAENRPLEAEQLKKRLSKTGESDFFFSSLKVQMDGDVFLPVQELNHMRRTALEELRQKIVSSFYRMENPDKNIDTDSISAEDNLEWKSAPFVSERQNSDTEFTGEQPVLTVLAETLEQLEGIAEYLSVHPSSRIRRIYADCRISSRFFEDEKVISLLSGLRSAGKKVFPAMPHVFRKNDRIRLAEDAKQFIHFPMDGMLLRSCEEVSILLNSRFDKTIILDHNLYMFNRYAKKFWARHGITEFTAPAELSCKELSELGLASAELIVYGYIPVMISAQCISSAAGSCRKKSGLTFIEDRFRNRFPVKNNCSSCYNVIYNTLPVYLGNQQESLRQIAPEKLRIQFSVESRKQVGEILSLFEENDGGSPVCTEAPFSFTQGHFKRGII